MRTSIGLRLAIVAIVTAVVAGTSLAAYGYVFGFDDPRATAGPTTAAPLTVARTTAPSTTTTTVKATTTTRRVQGEPPIVQMPAGNYSVGSSGPAVLAYQQRLASLHFDPGAVDGHFGQDTQYAIETVQKLYGLPRTGVIDNAVRFALSVFKWPKEHVPAATAEANRAELDLDTQVLVVYQNFQVRLITTTSTGSGHAFCGGDQGCQYAVTPAGKYAFQWHYNGWRTSKLGHLWNPYYFNGGIAVHGYPDVPVYPASHGCARIPMDIANYFATLVTQGEPIYVVGTPAPETGTLPANPPSTSSTSTAPTTAPTTTVPHTTTTVHAPKSTTTTTHPTPTT